MSLRHDTTTTNLDASRTATPPRERDVLRVVRAQRTSDGAGVRLQRTIGTGVLPMLDPFLLLDEFSTDRPEYYVAGFPDHPHRGFETVSYMLEGAFEHKDHAGNSGLLGPGSVQWMTAGRGVIHSEMPKQERGKLHGFQLWLNLPAAQKMIPPRYQDIAAERIPEVRVGDARVRVLAGEAFAPPKADDAVPSTPLARGPVIRRGDRAAHARRRRPGRRLVRAAAPARIRRSSHVFEGSVTMERCARAGREGAGMLSPGSACASRARAAVGSSSGGASARRAGRPLRSRRDEHGGGDLAGLPRLRERAPHGVNDDGSGRTSRPLPSSGRVGWDSLDVPLSAKVRSHR